MDQKQNGEFITVGSSQNVRWPDLCGDDSGKKTCPEPANDGLVTELETEIATVNSVCDKVAEDIGKADADPALISIFNGGIGKIQAKIVSNMDQKQNGEFITVGSSQRRATPEPVTCKETAGAPPRVPVSNKSHSVCPVITIDDVPVPVAESGEEKKLREFRDAISDGEKATLNFNLDMGRIPVMNKDTMSKRATLALSAMAAKIESKPGKSPSSVPSAESVEALDDVLSMVENMELYGNETKTYKHPSDKLSGAFCTVPVGYEFSTPAIKFKAKKFYGKCAEPSAPLPTLWESGSVLNRL
jgi:hypothetical protein